MGRDLPQVEVARVFANDPPDGVLGEGFLGDYVGFANRPEHGAGLDASAIEPRIEHFLDPGRHRNRADPISLPRIKFRVSAMLGFKSFENAKIVLAGIELIQKLKKGQYGVPYRFGMTSRQIWSNVLAAQLNEGATERTAPTLDSTNRAAWCPPAPDTLKALP